MSANKPFNFKKIDPLSPNPPSSRNTHHTRRWVLPQFRSRLLRATRSGSPTRLVKEWRLQSSPLPRRFVESTSISDGSSLRHGSPDQGRRASTLTRTERSSSISTVGVSGRPSIHRIMKAKCYSLFVGQHAFRPGNDLGGT